jgi:ankyrin repeat protein
LQGNGNMEAVKLLIEKGADVNAVNQFGFTPLHVAISNRLSGIVRVLLKAGADPLIKTIPGELDGALAGTLPNKEAACRF